MPHATAHEDFGRRETGSIDRARQIASRFVHTVIPSKLEGEKPTAHADEVWMEIEPEILPPRIDNPATRYEFGGTASSSIFHGCENPGAWDEVFAAYRRVRPTQLGRRANGGSCASG